MYSFLGNPNFNWPRQRQGQVMPTESKPADPFGPNGRKFHLHLSVRGALRDCSKRQLKGMFRFDGGRACTADEAKDHLLEALAQGKEVLPFGPPCEGFDFSGGGCQGHDLVAKEVQP